MTGLAVRAIDLHDLEASLLPRARETGAIRAGALHTHQHHRAQRAQPLDQPPIALVVHRERLDAQHPAHRINGRGHVHVQVRVHAADHRTRALYDGHAHPFSRSGSRGGAHLPGG
jgi:hypothetical protein